MEGVCLHQEKCEVHKKWDMQSHTFDVQLFEDLYPVEKNGAAETPESINSKISYSEI